MAPVVSAPPSSTASRLLQRRCYWCALIAVLALIAFRVTMSSGDDRVETASAPPGPPAPQQARLTTRTSTSATTGSVVTPDTMLGEGQFAGAAPPLGAGVDSTVAMATNSANGQGSDGPAEGDVASTGRSHHQEAATGNGASGRGGGGSNNPRRLKVAVAVLVTTGTKTPDLNPTYDAMAVLRHSILAAPAESDLDRSLDLEFIALVTPEVDARARFLLEWFGYTIVIKESPVQPEHVRNKQIAKEVVTDGAMGIAEMVKVYGFTMTEYDYIVMVDADILFHKHIGNVIADFQKQPTAALGWTRGGWESERINGGFLVFQPSSHGQTHYDLIVATLREGDFRPGSGWRGKGIGWTYGGRTIQGLLPYHFFAYLPKHPEAIPSSTMQPAAEDSDANSNDQLGRPPTTSDDSDDEAKGKARLLLDGSFSPADVKLDRCKYNNMVQLEPCKATPIDDVVSNHFTGDCMKPWWCAGAKHKLCRQFSDRWWKRWEEMRDEIVSRLTTTTNGQGALRTVRGLHGRCARGFTPFSKSLYEIAHEAHAAKKNGGADSDQASIGGSTD